MDFKLSSEQELNQRGRLPAGLKTNNVATVMESRDVRTSVRSGASLTESSCVSSSLEVVKEYSAFGLDQRLPVCQINASDGEQTQPAPVVEILLRSFFCCWTVKTNIVAPSDQW